MKSEESEEKAYDLLNEIYEITGLYSNCKDLALFVVNEVKQIVDFGRDFDEIQHWEEIKQIIEKL